MAITIEFPSELEKTLIQLAAKNGSDVNRFIVQAVQEKLDKARTFDEVCAPFVQAVAATGLSDDEFDRFFEEARQDVWKEKQNQAR